MLFVHNTKIPIPQQHMYSCEYTDLVYVCILVVPSQDESQYIMEVVKDSQPSLVLQGDGRVSFRMQWSQ